MNILFTPEDEHGTYIMNSKDLRAIEHVEQLTKMGVHSLKIEGRTKSFYYCARTACIAVLLMMLLQVSLLIQHC